MSRHLPYIRDIIHELGDLAVHIDIAGGEIGLLDSETLRYFFKTIDRPIVVSTNGMFMEKGYQHDPEIKPYIKEIQWHVHPSPKGGIVVKDWIDDNINKGIVYDNADDMVEFIKTNSNITFNYVEFEFPMDEPLKKDNKMYEDLFNKIKDLQNVTQNAKNIVANRITENPNLRNLCEKFNQTVVTDLVNERIMFCHRSQNVTIPLTKRNFLRRITMFPKYLFDGNTKCDSCTRLYAGKMSGNEIETYFKVKGRI
jgi:hypothetical protein